jgi:hypothetical protein
MSDPPRRRCIPSGGVANPQDYGHAGRVDIHAMATARAPGYLRSDDSWLDRRHVGSAPGPGGAARTRGRPRGRARALPPTSTRASRAPLAHVPRQPGWGGAPACGAHQERPARSKEQRYDPANGTPSQAKPRDDVTSARLAHHRSQTSHAVRPEREEQKRRAPQAAAPPHPGSHHVRISVLRPGRSQPAVPKNKSGRGVREE